VSARCSKAHKRNHLPARKLMHNFITFHKALSFLVNQKSYVVHNTPSLHGGVYNYVTRVNDDIIVVMHLFIYFHSLITVLYDDNSENDDNEKEDRQTTFICVVTHRRNVTVISPCKQSATVLSVCLSIWLLLLLLPTTSLPVIYSHICRRIKPPTAAAKTTGRDRRKKFSYQAARGRSDN